MLASCLLLGCSAADGGAGKAGPPGTDGTDGDDGTMGLIGKAGDPGDKGTMGLRGATGPKGARGATGAKGDTGAQGMDGTSCSVTDNGNGTKTVSCDDSTSATVADGDMGAKGDKGDPGDNGQPGAAAPITVLDANGVELGRFISYFAPPDIVVRSTGGVFIVYDSTTGVVWGYPHVGRTNLQFESADCTGPAYDRWKGQIIGGASQTTTDLFRVEGQRAMRMILSSLDDDGLVCSPVSELRDTVLVSHVGLLPPTAPTPFELQIQ